jgi:NAD(P)-dependent dehydrogenase (short-subunit alcohol dehydrogenase family)
LDGKVIAVTGAGRGIGRAVAMGAAAEGASVIVNDYGVSIDGNEPTSEVADAVVKEITDAGGRAAANAQSVTTMEGGASIVEQAVDTFGRIDGVVCVAASWGAHAVQHVQEEWDPVVKTHLKGGLHGLSRRARRSGGRRRHADRLHRRVRGRRRAGELLGAKGGHRLARPARRRRTSTT